MDIQHYDYKTDMPPDKAEEALENYALGTNAHKHPGLFEYLILDDSTNGDFSARIYELSELDGKYSCRTALVTEDKVEHEGALPTEKVRDIKERYKEL